MHNRSVIGVHCWPRPFLSRFVSFLFVFFPFISLRLTIINSSVFLFCIYYYFCIATRQISPSGAYVRLLGHPNTTALYFQPGYTRPSRLASTAEAQSNNFFELVRLLQCVKVPRGKRKKHGYGEIRRYRTVASSLPVNPRTSPCMLAVEGRDYLREKS